MSKLAVLISISCAAACASSATIERSTTGYGSEPRARIQFDPSTIGDAAVAVFPTAIQLDAPSVDRLAHVVRTRLGSSASAELDLCVATDGRVSKVALARSSSLATFDAALLRDAESWQFASLPGPASVQSCRRTTVAYRGR